MQTYIAYGSNMDEEQMEVRCPGSRMIGTGILEGWRLMHKGSGTGAYATIEKEEGRQVPVVLWSITDEDEQALDRYEGFPRFYYKVKILVTKVRNPQGRAIGAEIMGMAYVMHEERGFGIPDVWYRNLLRRAYRRFGFRMDILEESFSYSFRKMCEKAHKIYKN